MELGAPVPALGRDERLPVDVAVSQDLEAHPDLLDGHRLFLSVGHDEYWSWGMREARRALHRRRRERAFFSGNTCYWQVRFEDDLRHMICFKYGADEDPVVGTPDERSVTSAWVDRRIGWPESSTTGLSFSRGGYSRYGLGVPEASGAYTVWRPDHWVFEGADLAYGDALGLADAIVAYEVDGCELTMVDGLPGSHARRRRPRDPRGARDRAREALDPARAAEPVRARAGRARVGRDGDPRRGLARSLRPLANNHAVRGVFTTPGGGTVFNAGCTDWTDGLGDPASSGSRGTCSSGSRAEAQTPSIAL